MDANAKFKVGEFKKGDSTQSVYLLNPGDCFERFGGSSRGLLVRKTASLIVRESSPCGITDTEFDVNDKRAWNHVFRVARAFDHIEA